jgi:two-component system heavy metal sensor histidine kinase CusS
MLTRLDESIQRLSQFSANLAHELRTPLHNLIGQTDVTLAQARLQKNISES